MPRSSSSDGISTYNAVPPPKEQKKFSHRRTSIKPKNALPKLMKDQSTLTQLDFLPRSSAVVPNSSDSEFDEPRPKKRRKKSKLGEKEKGQPTYTQFIRDPPPRSSTSRQSVEVDEEGFQIWEDDGADGFIEEVRKRQETRRRRLPWLDGEDIENTGPPLEVPETSQIGFQSPARRKDGDGMEVHLATAQPRTPKDVRFFEVPSSQTPTSPKLPTQSQPRITEVERSPLKERSVNVPPSHPSPTSQNISMKMLERVHLANRQAQLNDVVETPPSPAGEQSHEGHLTVEAEAAPMMQPPRKLQRVTTIQDSEPDDDLSPPDVDVVSMQSLKRVVTVQDSQYDDDVEIVSNCSHDPDDDLGDKADHYEADQDKPSQNVAEQDKAAQGEAPQDQVDREDEDQDEVDQDEADEDQADRDEEDQDETRSNFRDTQQGTFDPANSALDRDASRFLWTQPHATLSNIDEGNVEYETDDEDLDRGCDFDHEPVIPPFHASSRLSDQPKHPVRNGLRETTKPADYDKPENHATFLAKTQTQEDSAYESGTPPQREEIDLRSSPPPLRSSQQPPRPSQVSTVVPTQISPRRPYSSSRAPLFDSPQKSFATGRFSLMSSPQKPSSLWQETLSSSPLPLPNWISPETGRFVNRGQDTAPKSDPRLESLVDFSLPPPPPLSSSRRQTPASSSR